MGHTLGLGHSQDLNALMYYDESLKQNLALAQDDIDGITYLYPRNELGNDKTMGCSTVSLKSPPPSMGTRISILFMLFAPVGLAAYLRRKLRVH